MSSHQGVFITFEGTEGSGKSSAISRVIPTIQKKYPELEIVTTREPGSTKTGSKIRSLLLDPENTDICGQTEVFLYCADRVQNIHEVVLPALKRGALVICDRYIDSTVAYQHYGRGQSIELIKALNTYSTYGVVPDRTLLFDLPVEVGLARANKDLDNNNRTIDETRFENEHLDFHYQVRSGYLKQAYACHNRIVKVQAEMSVDDVTQQCYDYIVNLIEERAVRHAK